LRRDISLGAAQATARSPPPLLLGGNPRDNADRPPPQPLPVVLCCCRGWTRALPEAGCLAGPVPTQPRAAGARALGPPPLHNTATRSTIPRHRRCPRLCPSSLGHAARSTLVRAERPPPDPPSRHRARPAAGSLRVPVWPTPWPPAAALAAGSYHTSALATVDGTSWCWGRNIEGQVGDGLTGTLDRSNPVAVSGGLTFIAPSPSLTPSTTPSQTYSGTTSP
jgi:hypothetical protein